MKKNKEFIEINQEKLYRSVENYNYYNMYGYFQEQCRFIKMNKNISYYSRRIDFFSNVSILLNLLTQQTTYVNLEITV